jgi:hypothetical protein
MALSMPYTVLFKENSFPRCSQQPIGKHRSGFILDSAVETESACRFDRLKAPRGSRGWRSPLRGVEASTAEFRFIPAGPGERDSVERNIDSNEVP